MWLTANYSTVGEDAIAHAHAIKTEALRKLGEMLKEMPRNEGEKDRFAGSTNKAPPAEGAPTLSDPGITKKTSYSFCFKGWNFGMDEGQATAPPR